MTPFYSGRGKRVSLTIVCVVLERKSVCYLLESETGRELHGRVIVIAKATPSYSSEITR